MAISKEQETELNKEFAEGVREDMSWISERAGERIKDFPIGEIAALASVSTLNRMIKHLQYSPGLEHWAGAVSGSYHHVNENKLKFMDKKGDTIQARPRRWKSGLATMQRLGINLGAHNG